MVQYELIIRLNVGAFQLLSKQETVIHRWGNTLS